MAGRPPLAVTMGDPAGIGPELAAKAWQARRRASLLPFYWIGDPAALAAVSPVPLREIGAPHEAAAAFPDALPVLPMALARPPRPGRPDEANAATVLASIDRAVADARAGEAAAVVTAPVAKHVLYQAGWCHPGQTEYLADLCDRTPADVAMMLAAPMLKVVPVTIHVALADVPALIDRALIERRARIAHAALVRDFALPAPRLAVCGLNPHAGEGGALGREEIDIIAPAIAALRQDGIDASGPHAADSLFHADARASYDAALAMYHDQALIPLKTLDFHGGVNCTLGLPVIRTSPDHGTAFAIAGRDAANPSSFIAALTLAARMAAARASHDAGGNHGG